MPFRSFGLSSEVIEALQRAGFQKPTPIQLKALPVVIAGKDVIAQAETGSGKTLAFLLPIIERADHHRVSPQALILTPTRELAQQIQVEFERFAPAKKLKTALLIGGESMVRQILTLRDGAQVIIGTPGRIIDHLQSRTLRLAWVQFLVLDEADEMLDMGFIDAIRQILKKCPRERQTMLFSATIPPDVEKLAHTCTHDPVQVRTIEGLKTVDSVNQQVVEVSPEGKFEKLCEILDADDRNVYLVFCQTRREVDVLYRRLVGRGHAVGALHGDFSQEHRTKVMERFRKAHLRVLVATDVASRGLDIDVVTHVINYSVPRDPRRYVHRVGRTARAGRAGVAITFVCQQDRGRLRSLKQVEGAELGGAGAESRRSRNVAGGTRSGRRKQRVENKGNGRRGRSARRRTGNR